MKERKIPHQKLLACFSTQQYGKAKEIMNAWDNEQIAEFLFYNPAAQPAMRQNELDDFWEQRLAALRLPNDPDFCFKSQPGIRNADFVCGYLLYLLELKSKDNDTMAAVKDKFKPTDLISFHLIKRRLHFIFLSLRQAQEEDLQAFARVLYNLEAFAKTQGTPGYLVLANAYMQSALRYHKLQQKDQCQSLFKMCWNYLHLADLAEIDSEVAINNAYFGKGLTLSTPFNLNTIAEIKSRCKLMAGSFLPESNRISAEGSAESMYRKVKESLDSDRNRTDFKL